MTVVSPFKPDQALAPGLEPLPGDVAAYCERLAEAGFAGEIARDAGSRIVHATDNSIYRLEPAAVLFPACAGDVEIAVASAAEWQGRIPLAARGGATGTNGQSLTRGIVLDTSRHLTRILALDVAARTVTVEPGLVLDALNEHLKAYDLFFPPTVSTASRATIGGMVATDASGKGSRIYGRTSDYIEVMDVVLSDGTPYTVRRLDPAALEAECRREDIVGTIHREARRVARDRRERISEVFPDMNRGLTGYNLKGLERSDGSFALPSLLAGSEGTLAITRSVTLRLLPRPKHRALVVLGYDDFSAALAHVGDLLRTEPAAIEILDDKILALAKGDLLWSRIEGILGATAKIGGLNFVEFVGETAEAIDARLNELDRVLGETSAGGPVLRATVVDSGVIADLWELRKKSVGLLGRLPGARQGVPFVEDTAVPPERLPAFVAEFRALLDSHGLSYGMFGHADVGCLHVRPALDMRDPVDRKLIRVVSDEVALLTRRYGGLIWGEHGRGFRGEFSPLYFGHELYEELCRLKAAFDPHDMLNPGKLARPLAESPVERIDAVPFRGARDAEITGTDAFAFDRALACNGNGACHAIDPFDAMCPSFKATGDRAQSPKGRASLLREWARLDGAVRQGQADRGELAEIEDSLYASLSTCLSCKACASQCPVRVDIPAMRSRFLERRYETASRPRRDRLVSHLETVTGIAARLPAVSNAVLRNRVVSTLLKQGFGLVDLPRFSPRRPEARLSRRRHETVVPSKAVILVQDTFTSRFDADVPVAASRLLEALGYRVHLAPVVANGKALHVLGFRRRFRSAAARARRQAAELASSGIPLVAVEAVAALMHAQEYREDCDEPASRVATLDEFLAEELASGRLRLQSGPDVVGPPFQILLHCTEKTAQPRVGERWRAIFSAFGLAAECPSLGCCGMAGLFGHQREHQSISRRLFDMSWRPRIESVDPARVLATGFSCRCQTERLATFRPRHPAEALLHHLERTGCRPC